MEKRKEQIGQLLLFKEKVEKEYGDKARDLLLEVDKIIESIDSVKGGKIEQLQVSLKNLDAAFQRLYLITNKCSNKEH